MSVFDRIMLTNIIVTVVAVILIYAFDDDTPGILAYIGAFSLALNPIMLIIRIWTI